MINPLNVINLGMPDSTCYFRKFSSLSSLGVVVVEA